jgi:hypothetical protein
MTEGEILFDAINIRCPEHLGPAQRTPTLGTFPHKQMSFPRAPEQHLAPAGYFETLRYGLPGFNTLRPTHTDTLSLLASGTIPNPDCWSAKRIAHGDPAQREMGTDGSGANHAPPFRHVGSVNVAG